MTDSLGESTATKTAPTEQPERLDLRSHDISSDKQAELLRLFPEVRTEGGKIDFDRLKRVLGEIVDPGKERYAMNWPGRADCFKAIQQPSLGTLMPSRDESIKFDTTENLFIEGDNLEVLKLLQKAYLGKIKMIYIDPPYNTGNDFIYPDNYSESLQTYLEYTGQVDSEGRKFSTNTEADGRFHSKWMNMMLPRLYLARNLLRSDGVMFISIDEKEVGNLRRLCDEVFGEENHIEDLVWAQNTTHSQSPLYSTNHEYVIVYARDAALLEEQREAFREPKPGFEELQSLVTRLNPSYPSVQVIETEIASLQSEHRKEYEATLVEAGLVLDEETEREDPWRGTYAYKHAEYRDEEGNLVSETDAGAVHARIVVWRISDPSGPASKQAASTKDPSSPNYRFYRPLHPKTKRECPHPKRGWAWPKSWRDDSRESFDGLDKKGKIYWGDDETTVPQFKRFLEDVETNVAKSFFYDYTDGEKQLAELFGRTALFPNPKPTTLVSRLMLQVCKDGDIVLDFFAGSGSSADAAIRLWSSGQLRAKFILVQLPEVLDPTNKDQADAAVFCDEIGRPRTIAEITKERIRRAVAKFTDRQRTLLPHGADAVLGFKVFKLAESNFKTWRAELGGNDSSVLAAQLDMHIDHIRSGRTAEDILSELLLKSGFALDTAIHEATVAGKTIYGISEGAMLICLEHDLTIELIRALADRAPQRVILLDEGFAGNDQLKTNAVQIMKSKGVTSFRTV